MDIVRFMTLTVCSNSLQLDAYKPIVRYVHELLNNKTRRDYVTDSEGCSGDDCWTMSVTGHSLGGCLALIVGTTLEIPVNMFLRHFLSCLIHLSQGHNKCIDIVHTLFVVGYVFRPRSDVCKGTI